MQIESYNFFAAQPVPTPPPWWRYAKKETKNESAIGKFPSLASDKSLQQLYRKRIPGWTTLGREAGYSEKYEVSHLPPPLRYHDARQYEVFQTGCIMRDVEFETTNRSSKTFNGRYEFNFEPLMSAHAVSERSFVIRLDARSRSIETLAPPDSGTQVTMSVTLGQDPVPTEFVGNVISTPPGDNEYEIAMILTRKGGGSGLVYNDHSKCFIVPVSPGIAKPY